jgi:hypothetical protein
MYASRALIEALDTMRTCTRRFAALLVLSACCSGITVAQEIEPRAYSPSPVGVNFLISAVAHSEGGVLTDPSLPVTDIEAQIDALVLGYGRTFSLAGRSANLGISVPYIHVDASGDIGENRASVSREGAGDTKIRVAMNLIGAPAMTPQEFARREPQTTLGASITLSAPTGQYDPDRLVNIGTNRWAAKTELGLQKPIGKWFLEVYAGAWWFADNDNFFGGKLREQDPLTSVQAHVTYMINARSWLALNTTYYTGGQTTLDGTTKHDRQANSRAGLTLSLPMGKRYSLKCSWSRGATTRIGSDFTNYSVAIQYAWLDRAARP